MKKIVDFYIQSSLHVALAITAVACITYWNFKMPLNEWYVAFIFSGTVVGYNVLKYVRFWINNSIQNRYFYVTSVFLGFCLYIFYGHFDFYMRAHVFLHFVLVMGYFWLRRYAYFKLLYVASVVTGLTVMYPMYETTGSWMINLYSFKQFLLLFALLIPFEIADSKTDDLLTKTLPQRFGVLLAKKLGYLATLGFVLLSLQLWYTPVADVVMGVCTLWMIFLAHENRSRYFTSLGVEALPILWAVLIFLETSL